MKPLYYTFEADVHCPLCTLQRFPAPFGSRGALSCDLNGVDMGAVDNDGNPVHAVMPYNELQTDLTDEEGGTPIIVCCECGDILAMRDKSLEGSQHVECQVS